MYVGVRHVRSTNERRWGEGGGGGTYFCFDFYCFVYVMKGIREVTKVEGQH